MSNYHQLLNQLEDLDLLYIRESLPDSLDRIVQNEMSFVDALLELTAVELQKRKNKKMNSVCIEHSFHSKKESMILILAFSHK